MLHIPWNLVCVEDSIADPSEYSFAEASHVLIDHHLESFSMSGSIFVFDGTANARTFPNSKTGNKRHRLCRMKGVEKNGKFAIFSSLIMTFKRIWNDEIIRKIGGEALRSCFILWELWSSFLRRDHAVPLFSGKHSADKMNHLLTLSRISCVHLQIQAHVLMRTF